jgi:hypothetical protein
MPDFLEHRGETFFTIVDVDEQFRFQADFADGPAIVTEGYGGWKITSRPRDVGLTEWAGRNPMAIEIPFMLDFWMSEVSDDPGVQCENMIKNLERLCGIGGHAQPPVCIVDGGGAIPHDYSVSPTLRWVIENVSWDRGMELRSGTSSRRMRAGGNITIRQFVQASAIFRTINARSRAAVPKQFVVSKRYNTLSKIAALVYDDANKWKIIGDANGIRDRRKLKIGKSIKIPPL